MLKAEAEIAGEEQFSFRGVRVEVQPRGVEDVLVVGESQGGGGGDEGCEAEEIQEKRIIGGEDGGCHCYLG